PPAPRPRPRPRDAQAPPRLRQRRHRPAGDRLLMALTLLLGGARSGKSALAERLGARRGGPGRVVATAQARDAEMAERIRRHRGQRPADWRTIEEPFDLETAIANGPAGTYGVGDWLTLGVAHR